MPKIQSLCFTIEEYLNQHYGLDVSAKYSHIDKNESIKEPYKEIFYKFKCELFIKFRADITIVRRFEQIQREVLQNSIRKVLSDHNITNSNVQYIESRNIGEYSTISFEVSFTKLEDIKKAMHKYRFISK